jgi:hypothetical protein
MEGDAKRVRRLSAELVRHALVDVRDAAVEGDDVPVSIDGEGRVRLVRRQEPLECFPHRRHFPFVE